MTDPASGGGDPDPLFRSGFVTLVGRPNVGKSTLLNHLIGTKVSIVSDRPQTTRNQIRGVRTTPGSQIVFLDTPGIHKPRTMLGERTNDRAISTFDEVDLICLLIEANRPIGPGDRFIANLIHRSRTPKLLLVNKIDVAEKEQVFDHLAVATDALGVFDAYIPVSGRTGEHTDVLIEEVLARLPVGPRYYPEGEVTDQPETFIAAEIVREKLLTVARDELPHSITVTVEEIEPGDDDEPRPDLLSLRAVVRVERDSQKGIVIGKGGAVLKAAGTQARQELEALFGTKVFLETFVKVDKDWQRRSHALDRLGF